MHCAAQRYAGVYSLYVFAQDYQVSVSQTDGNRATPLHFAALSGLLKNAQVLIKFGAPVNMQDDDGNTPLHIAVLQLI